MAALLLVALAAPAAQGRARYVFTVAGDGVSGFGGDGGPATQAALNLHEPSRSCPAEASWWPRRTTTRCAG